MCMTDAVCIVLAQTYAGSRIEYDDVGPSAVVYNGSALHYIYAVT